MKRLSVLQQAALVVIAILLLDQSVKIWIKMSMKIGDSISVFGNWFYILFTENRGMAFGMEFGGDFGKLALSLFRIVAVIGIGWYLHKLSKTQASKGLVIGLALVLAGALGNIIDSAVYGMLFTDSYGRIAEFLPAAGGYSSFLHGRVVDMLYFPLVDTVLPDNFPILGGRRFVFFQFIFNVADSAITCGAAYLLIFQYKFFSKK